MVRQQVEEVPSARAGAAAAGAAREDGQGVGEAARDRDPRTHPRRRLLLRQLPQIRPAHLQRRSIREYWLSHPPSSSFFFEFFSSFQDIRGIVAYLTSNAVDIC